MSENKLGRPTKYNEEYCDAIIELAKRGYHMYKIAVTWDVCHDTLLEWKHTHPRFSAAYARAKAIQTMQLLDKMMDNVGNRDFNHKVAALLLAHVAKLSEERDLSIEGLGEGTLSEQGRKALKSGSKSKVTASELSKVVDAISKLAKVEEVTELRKKVEEFEKLTRK